MVWRALVDTHSVLCPPRGGPRVAPVVPCDGRPPPLYLDSGLVTRQDKCKRRGGRPVINDSKRARASQDQLRFQVGHHRHQLVTRCWYAATAAVLCGGAARRCAPPTGASASSGQDEELVLVLVLVLKFRASFEAARAGPTLPFVGVKTRRSAPKQASSNAAIGNKKNASDTIRVAAGLALKKKKTWLDQIDDFGDERRSWNSSWNLGLRC